MGYSIDAVPEASAFDSRLAEIVRDRAAPTLAVLGAGFTGIELTLELRDRIALHGRQEQAEQARILLIDRADAVGPELGAGPRPVIEAALREARVELHLAVAVAALRRDRVVLADGETIDADAVVLLTTGMVPTPFRGCVVPGEHDALGTHSERRADVLALGSRAVRADQASPAGQVSRSAADRTSVLLPTPSPAGNREDGWRTSSERGGGVLRRR
jgi:NADH dehydrogenase FAD-containing subunit